MVFAGMKETPCNLDFLDDSEEEGPVISSHKVVEESFSDAFESRLISAGHEYIVQSGNCCRHWKHSNAYIPA